jgi:uncharacterized protein
MSSITEQYFPALAVELRNTGTAGILVSGGADSEILLRAAADVLGASNTTAFNAVTPFLAACYTTLVRKVTDQLGVKLINIPLNLLNIQEVRMNTRQRCYHCKRAIYSAVTDAAHELDIKTLADGTNLDDLSEYRPGLRAAEELIISHPFVMGGMSGNDVRSLGKVLGMPDYLRPPDSCLATRLSENTTITPESLALAAEIEQPLRPHAKKRLRALISPAGVTLEYQTKDKVLVETHRQELNSIAESYGLGIAFHENT